MIKEKNFRKCDSVSSASSRRALEQIVPAGLRNIQQKFPVRVNKTITKTDVLELYVHLAAINQFGRVCIAPR